MKDDVERTIAGGDEGRHSGGIDAAMKRAIELATAAGIPTHVHSCGPEKELVRITAEETSLTVIDPLEAPPMGDVIWPN